MTLSHRPWNEIKEDAKQNKNMEETLEWKSRKHEITKRK